MYIHNTIRKYTLALLNFFNELEIQYNDSNGSVINKKIPIIYRNKEKHSLMDKSIIQELNGNMNVLPRGTLSLTQLAKSSERNTSKYNKFAFKRDDLDMEYMYNPVAYDITYDLSILCRGMNEACQIIEEIAPKFNPNIAIDVWDADNLKEPSRIPIQLADISPEVVSLDEYSANLIRVTAIVIVYGWLFPPIRTYKKVKNFNMNLDMVNREQIMLGFDVIDHELYNARTEIKANRDCDFYINVIDLVKTDNKIKVIVDTNSKKKPNINFKSENCLISNIVDDTCTVIKTDSNEFTISCIVKLYDEIVTISKDFSF